MNERFFNCEAEALDKDGGDSGRIRSRSLLKNINDTETGPVESLQDNPGDGFQCLLISPKFD